MFRATREAVRLFVEVFEPHPPILELGAYQTLGLGAYPDVRPYFAGLEYVGTDIRSGPGVDRLEDAEALTFDDASFGAVVALDVLEHLRHPQDAVAEARRVLRDDGLLVVAVPCSYRIHGFPTDYWRFTTSGLQTLLVDFENCVTFALGPQVNPPLVFGIAAKEGVTDFAERAKLYRERVEKTYSSFSSRVRAHWSIARRFMRDGGGWMLGRAHVGVAFHDLDDAGGPYQPDEALRTRGRAPSR
jgi:SAM-dependent methyltransferase